MLLMWNNWTLETGLQKSSKEGKKGTPQKLFCSLEEEEEIEIHIYNINSLKGSVDPLKIGVKLDGCSIYMKIDTDAMGYVRNHI